MHIVYRHVNKVNGKSYIGFTPRTSRTDCSSFTPEQTLAHANHLMMIRWKMHLYAARKGFTYAFSNAIRKYGSDAFDHEILEICHSPKEGLEREKHWIEKFKSITHLNGYNLTNGGDGLCGWKRSPEQLHSFKEAMNRPEVRANNSRIQKIVSNTPEAKARRSAISLRIMKDPVMRTLIAERTRESMNKPEIIAKIAAYNANENTKIQRSERVKKSWKDPTTRAKRLAALDDITIRHAVIQYTLEGDEITRFRSVSEAARATNTHKASLLAHLHGKNHTAGGYTWKLLSTPLQCNFHALNITVRSRKVLTPVSG